MSRRRPGQLRIIGGQWRSRIIEFEAAGGVRPTPDRVRQVLFDWLSPRLEGAHCLDLFAGSGALGFEALSRGAASVSFVETGTAQAQAIRRAIDKLGAHNAGVVTQDAREVLRDAAPAFFDVVFLDPPYDSPLMGEVLARLPASLKPGNRVYLEWRAPRRPGLAPPWQWLKEKQAGQVSYGLATYSAGERDERA